MKKFVLLFLLTLSFDGFAQEPEYIDAPRNHARGNFSAIHYLKSDNYGSIYQIGDFSDSIQFAYQEDMLYSEEGQDVFIRKIDPKGKTIWAKNFNIAYLDDPNAVTIIDSSIYLVYGTIIRNFYAAGSHRYYYAVVELDLNGVVKSKNNYSRPGSLVIRDISLNNGNQLLTTAVIYDSASIRMNGKDTMFRRIHGSNIIMNLNLQGEILSVTELKTNDSITSLKVVKHENNMFYITGQYNGTILDTIEHEGPYYDAFVAQCDTLGNILKIKTFSSTHTDGFADIKLHDNHIYVCGIYRDDSKPVNVQYPLQARAALIKLNMQLEVDTILNPNYWHINAIDFTDNGIIAMGSIYNEDSFFRDNKTVLYSSVEGPTSVITKYDNDLNWVWSQSLVTQGNLIGGQRNHFSSLLVLDDAIYVSGSCSYGTYRFDFIHGKSLSITSDAQRKALSIKLKDCDLNPGVQMEGSLLTAKEEDAEYLWLKFNGNYNALSNEKLQIFEPKENGIYAVRVTKKGCSALSEFVDIRTLGINRKVIKIGTYPNPASHKLNVRLASKHIANYKIIDTQGKLIQSGQMMTSSIDISTIDKGTYFLLLEQTEIHYTSTFIKF